MLRLTTLWYVIWRSCKECEIPLIQDGIFGCLISFVLILFYAYLAGEALRTSRTDC